MGYKQGHKALYEFQLLQRRRRRRRRRRGCCYPSSRTLWYKQPVSIAMPHTMYSHVTTNSVNNVIEINFLSIHMPMQQPYSPLHRQQHNKDKTNKSNKEESKTQHNEKHIQLQTRVLAEEEEEKKKKFFCRSSHVSMIIIILKFRYLKLWYRSSSQASKCCRRTSSLDGVCVDNKV
jgi:hypothetical protein